MWDLTTAMDLHTRMAAMGLSSIVSASEAVKSPSSNLNGGGTSGSATSGVATASCLGISTIALNNLQMQRQYLGILQVFLF